MEEWNKDLFDKLEDQILEDSFVLKNLNYTHYYFSDPDNYVGGIISTSVRVYPNKDIWTKRVVTTYFDSNLSEREISYERDINEDVINSIEKNVDLRKLDNNYSNEKLTGNEDTFELIYNNIYKVLGTTDKHIKEIDYIKDMLMINDILEDEKKKVSDLL